MGMLASALFGGQGALNQAQSGNIQQPLTGQDLINGNNQALGGLQQQQAFLNAVQGQHGLSHLNNAYNQYQGLANGTGPNPALAMLQQATGQNNAAQAALMAGQRGASANAGLIARQAGMQGAANQQNAIGQGASLQAQQQLAGMQGAAGIAGQQVGLQQNAVTGLNQFAQGYQGQIGQQLGAQNTANVGMQSNINNANAGLAGEQLKTQSGALGGLLNAGGAALGLAHGGSVPNLPAGPRSFIAQYMTGMAQGGQVGPLRGEAYAQNVAPVPGAAFSAGDSPKNDTVPAMLSPGEIVVPRSHAADPEKAAMFAYQVALRSRKGQ